jgi:hypothetical protein
MSIFGKIMDKIFHGAKPAAAKPAAPASAAPRPAQQPAARPATAGAGASAGAGATAAPAAAAPQAAAVDVEAVLTQLAAAKGGGGNWQTSIVDLLKLLDLDSSLDARKELAQELNVHAGADGSAEQNIALHKAVMRQLAANGGKVPASMRD